MPLAELGGRLERIAVAEGLERVYVRIAEMIEEVRFSREYRALESVAVGCTVAAWGFIFGRWGRVSIPGVVPGAALVAMLAVSVRFAFSVGVGVTATGAGVDGCGMPVRDVQISAIGGSGSEYGIVKRGLSQRLWVLGSS